MICAGSAACVADLLTFPFDVAKVRLQVAQNNVGNAAKSGLFGTLLNLAKTEGIASWWNGIIPGLQRQCVFASIRIGMYDSTKSFYSDLFGIDERNSTSVMPIRILSGITSGAVAISFAQPTDVVKVRMQAARGATGSVPVTSGDMYKSIYRERGLKGLWVGLLPNMARNSVVNATELVAYDTFKDFFIRNKILNDGLSCHFSAGFAAGFMATLVASPIDVVKTRVMNSSENSSFIKCAQELASKEGFFGFYKGFTPSFMRMGTWNICMFVTFEQFKLLSQRMDKSAFIERLPIHFGSLSLMEKRKDLLK